VNKDEAKRIIKHLSQSPIFRDYERAFSEATGLPLTLRPVEIWNAAQQGKKHENPFCALIGSFSRTCAACLAAQQKLSDPKAGHTKTITCFAGLCDSAVPIYLGEEVIGFLQTGQVATRKPCRDQFKRITRQLLEWGVKVDLKKLETAYFHSRVVSTEQYQAMLRLLEIFAQHLSIVSNQVMLQQQNEEPPMVHRAKEFINQHKSENLSLGQVARSVNVSVFYFCKIFKKATGLHFTEYLSRVRVEKAKNLLLNPNLRVSEIAFEVGFQSLTHFNRVFYRLVGRSPTAYRRSLPAYPDAS
jgi:AraC-like DNA-binding protein/ligand-binding sensor protein